MGLDTGKAMSKALPASPGGWFSTSRLIRWTGWLVLLVGMGLGIPGVRADDEAKGELRIEGKFINKLVLSKIEGDGPPEIVLDSPGASVSLSEGKYYWKEIALDGGESVGLFSSNNWFPEPGARISISRDKPATLKVGGPLKSVITAQRSGNVLRLSYQLLGAGGEEYIADNRARPTYAVYRKGEQIASGSFEYG